MQSVSSRIWTRVAVSIFYDDNYYTTGASKTYLVYKYVSVSVSACICMSKCVCGCEGRERERERIKFYWIICIGFTMKRSGSFELRMFNPWRHFFFKGTCSLKSPSVRFHNISSTNDPQRDRRSNDAMIFKADTYNDFLSRRNDVWQLS